MIIEPRVFNKRTGVMTYLPKLKCGFGGVLSIPSVLPKDPLLPDDPIMIKTPMKEMGGKYLYEGDIVECGIMASYGMVQERGVVVWRPEINCFSINIVNKYDGEVQFSVLNAKLLGNIYEHPDILTHTKEYRDTLQDNEKEK